MAWTITGVQLSAREAQRFTGLRVHGGAVTPAADTSKCDDSRGVEAPMTYEHLQTPPTNAMTYEGSRLR